MKNTAAARNDPANTTMIGTGKPSPTVAENAAKTKDELGIKKYPALESCLDIAVAIQEDHAHSG